MPANFVMRRAVGVDKHSQNLIPVFARMTDQYYGSGSVSWEASNHWYCQEIEWTLGPEPAEAIVNIRNNLNVSDERAGYVAFNADGPHSFIKHGSRCAIQRVWKTQSGYEHTQWVFIGSVVDIRHDKDAGGMAVVVQDDRRYLKNIQIIGSYVLDPGSGLPSSTRVYEQGRPFHANPGGKPNCIWTSDGVPVMAPYPDYGLGEDELPPDPDDAPTRKATYWTLSSILLYLYWHYGPYAPENDKFSWIETSPGDLFWPETLGANIDTESVANFDEGIGQNNSGQGTARKGRDVVLESRFLMEAIDYLFQKAGGWGLGVTYDVQTFGDGSDQWMTTLEAVPTRYPGDGVSIPFAAGGEAADTLNRAVVTGGSYEESSEELVTLVAGSGARASIERRVSTEGASASLEPAWDTDRHQQFIIEAAKQLDAEGFQKAAQLYWEVLTTWRLKTTWNFMEGTDYSDYPRANVARAIMTHLLSYSGSAYGSTPTGPTDQLSVPFPIRPEIKDSAGNWNAGPELDGLEVFDDGIIYIPQLRLAPLSSANGAWFWTTGTPYSTTTVGGETAINITTTDLRMTIAVQTPHRVTRAYGLPHHTSYSPDFQDIVEGLPDMERIEPYHYKTLHLDLRRLYHVWLRKDSWPRPESLSDEVSQADDYTSLSDAFRSDLDLMDSHLRRTLYDLGRLQKGGRLRFDGWLVGGYDPGTPIKELEPVGNSDLPEFPVRCIVGSKIWRVNPDDKANPVSTELVLR